MNTLTLQLPPESLSRLRLAPSPDGCVTLTWLELGMKLMLLTGDPLFGNFELLERSLASFFYGQCTARTLMTRCRDWQALAFESGMAALLEPAQITPLEAERWLACLAARIFFDRYDELKANPAMITSIQEALLGVSPEELHTLASDSPRPDQPCLINRTMQLYLRLYSDTLPQPSIPACAAVDAFVF